MATGPTVTLDSVENTSADIELIAAGGEIARGGWVDGLSGDPSTFLAQCMLLVNAKVPPGTAYPGTTLPYHRLQVRPSPSGDSAAVVLVYGVQGGGGVVTAYEITTRSYLATIATKIILATGEPILLKWTPPGQTNVARVAPVRETAMFPVREVTVSGISHGTATDAIYEKYEGPTWHVNKSPWRGRPTAYWMINDGGVDASPLAKTYGWHLSTISRNVCDWSEIRDFEDPRTGSPVPVADADKKKAANASYKQGIIAEVNGRTRWGQFPTIDFRPLFGFGGNTYWPVDTSGVKSLT